MTTTPLRIGQVHALLRAEAPDLELSKIRYYEDMGLVQPQRSKKGYRLYSERDVACLREAIRLADEEFVPLRVIRLRLIDQGLLDPTPATAATSRQAARAAVRGTVSRPAPESRAPMRALSVVPSPSAPTATGQGDELSEGASTSVPGDVTLTMNELLVDSGLEPDAMNRLVASGLLVPTTRGREVFFTSLDAAVARAAAPLLRDGADVRLLGSLRRVVEREMGILYDLTAAVRSPKADPEEVARVTRGVALELSALRTALYERALHDTAEH